MPPTNREIGRALNLPSTGHVDYHLTILEKTGLISRTYRKARGIQLLQEPLGIPVMGSIAAGQPLKIFTNSSEFLEVGFELEAQGVFALVVRGHSMIEDHICDGDYVVVKPQSTCENGDIVVAVHLEPDSAGEATLKRFFQEKGRKLVRLQPANSELEPIFIPQSEWDTEWQVQGKVVATVRNSAANEGENISAILKALKVGTRMSNNENSNEFQDDGKEASDRLTDLVKEKLRNEELVNNYQVQPEPWKKTLRDELEQVGVDKDKAILNAAKKVTSHITQENVFYDHVVTANNSNQEQLDKILKQCRDEARHWFRYSLLAAIIGFLVILIGVSLAIFTINVSLGFLTSLASIVPNVAALLFFRQANKANERLDSFYTKLVNIASIFQATELTLTINRETQDHFKGLIIRKWLGLTNEKD